MTAARIIADHLPWLNAQAAWYRLSPDDTADLAAETALKLMANARRYDPRKPFKPWARAVLANTYKSWLRKSRETLGELPDHPAHDRTDSLVLAREITDAISEACRESVAGNALRLYALGYSYEEIARIEGIPVGTVRSRVNTARRIVAAKLAR